MHIASIATLSLALSAAALSGCQSGSASSGESSQAASAAHFETDRTVTMSVKGMTCPFCASNLETFIEKIDGMERVDANLGTGRVLVQVTAVDDNTEATLRKAVDDSGFTIGSIELPR